MLNAAILEVPNPHHPQIRELVEQERIGEVLSSIGVSAHKLDDILKGLSETIGRCPQRFAREPHTGWSRVIIKAFPPEIPAIRIWFTYDDDHVYIEHVEALE